MVAMMPAVSAMPVQAEPRRVALDLVQQPRQAADDRFVRPQRRHLLDDRVDALELGRQGLQVRQLGLLP